MKKITQLLLLIAVLGLTSFSLPPHSTGSPVLEKILKKYPTGCDVHIENNYSRAVDAVEITTTLAHPLFSNIAITCCFITIACRRRISVFMQLWNSFWGCRIRQS